MKAIGTIGICGEYIIPKGFEAEIKDGRVIVRRKESEDERIRKNICRIVKDHMRHCAEAGIETGDHREALQYLEKQKERKPVENTPIYVDAAKKYFDSWIEMHRDSPTKWGCFWEGLLYSGKLPKPAEWTDADEKILERIINRQKFIIPVPEKDPDGFVLERREDTEAINWLKERVASRPQPNNNLRWRRATEGANLPESIIIPDGDDPRFGKCAVKDSWYIPISELKELPKE